MGTMASHTSTDAHAALSQAEHPTPAPSNSKRKEARARHRRKKAAQSAAEAGNKSDDAVEKATQIATEAGNKSDDAVEKATQIATEAGNKSDDTVEKTGVSEAEHAKSTSSVCDQSCENLYVTIRQQRQALFQGPKITLHAGSTAIGDMYKRVAMAASPVLHKYFVEHAERLEYSFQGDIAPGAVWYLLDTWMGDIRDVFEVYAVPGQDSFIKNVSLLRAARMLGMEQYVRHILEVHVKYLKNKLPTYEQIVIVESNATSDKDPLWTSMVNHLCHDRYKQMMPDAEDFGAFLEGHPRLKAAMASADAYFSGVAKKKWA
ncbi:hypothetical protein BDU57DRAFT_132248 [Ampelomyces quisqualis]|uniref:Uncharacterized protein n=1 Tax=Ampelomyces quisqualis TaxID=50730 RepID=A0A6A5QUL4_AMPQU|nr:hypothetical protein BDU57DRAFT_132248 [Ampelomyces quisqualis]